VSRGFCEPPLNRSIEILLALMLHGLTLRLPLCSIHGEVCLPIGRFTFQVTGRFRWPTFPAVRALLRGTPSYANPRTLNVTVSSAAGLLTSLDRCSWLGRAVHVMSSLPC